MDVFLKLHHVQVIMEPKQLVVTLQVMVKNVGEIQLQKQLVEIEHVQIKQQQLIKLIVNHF